VCRNATHSWYRDVTLGRCNVQALGCCNVQALGRRNVQALGCCSVTPIGSVTLDVCRGVAPSVCHDATLKRVVHNGFCHYLLDALVAFGIFSSGPTHWLINVRVLGSSDMLGARTPLHSGCSTNARVWHNVGASLAVKASGIRCVECTRA
jgi:hypothetical protein